MHISSRQNFINKASEVLNEALKVEGIIILDIEKKPNFQEVLLNIGELYYENVKKHIF